jgi:hypothetical protein
MDITTYAQKHNIRPRSIVTGLGRIPVEYTVSTVDPKGFTMMRPSGKPVRVSWRMVGETLARLQAGEMVKFQGNRSKGGIDGTSAKRDGVLAALRGLATRDGSIVVLAEGSAARTVQAS